MPEPGLYGPLPWSEPRPWSLWLYALLNGVLAVYFTVFIAEGDVDALGWVFGLTVLYLAWRGSKIAWGVSIVAVLLYLVVSAVEVEMSMSPGGHHPVLHVIEAALLLAMLILLVMPPTRRFYDLRSRESGARA